VEIAQFFEKYSLIFNHAPFHKEDLIKVDQLQRMIADACQEYIKLADEK
jgi:hypothetical protein